MSKIVDITRTVDGSYDIDGQFRNAWVRKEIVQRTEYEDGTVKIEVVGKWKNYEKARAECEAFNNEQYRRLNPE